MTFLNLCKRPVLVLVLAAVSLAACGDSADTGMVQENVQESADESAEPIGQSSGGAADPVAKPGNDGRLTLDQIQDDLDIPVLSQPWTGDLDAMVERRAIRVLTVYGLSRYFLDGAQERGIIYELFKQFEDDLNETLKTKRADRVHVLFIPVARDELLSGLDAGRGDIAAAGLTITPERLALADFTQPISKPLSEILVTGPSAPPLSTVEDLAGQTIHVRASSSYRASLETLNQSFEDAGRAPIQIEAISEFLEDADLLEMVNSGMLPWAVVDDYKAEMLVGVFDHLVVRDDIVFRQGGRLGYAMRKNSPQLQATLDEFMKTHKQGSLLGNILINRYIRDFDWSANALAGDEMEKFHKVADIFKKYGEQYGIDYLMVAAQGFQESRLDQSARSSAGAIGIMQLLPSTAADANVGIPDISTEDANIHAGVKYLSFIRDRYFNDPGIDAFNKALFAFAAYNAGPARVAKLRAEARQQGFDPNVWDGNVEVIAARVIGRETVQYVSNIAKYYVAYRLSMLRELQRAEAVSEMQQGD